MNDLSNWKEVTKGLYRYVIASNVCYEIHLHRWDFGTDILNARASLFIAGDWTDRERNNFFEREAISTGTVKECLEAAVKDNDICENPNKF